MANRTTLLSLYRTWEASSPRTELLCAVSTKRRYAKEAKKGGDKDRHGGGEERATSTAEELQRIAEEKTRETADKVQDAAIESAHGDEDTSASKPEKKMANPGTQSAG